MRSSPRSGRAQKRLAVAWGELVALFRHIRDATLFRLSRSECRQCLACSDLYHAWSKSADPQDRPKCLCAPVRRETRDERRTPSE